MLLNVYDRNFVQQTVVDVFFSLIWVKRWQKCGDFEIQIQFTGTFPSWLQTDYYVSLDEDEETGYYMIIENIQTVDDDENGKSILISGRSLECILDRRVVWDQTSYSNRKTSYILQDLLNKSIISPSLAIRKIENFKFEAPQSTDDFSTVNAEYTGDSIMDSAYGLVKIDDYDISVRHIDIDDVFICKMYKGTDRSYNQTKQQTVIFSPKLDNLTSSKYLVSIEEYRNVILAMGQGTGNNRTRYVLGDVSGLDRREYYKDARDVSTSNALKQRADEVMKELDVKRLLEGELISRQYVYGKDYFVGDIIQIENAYGIEQTARITEMIFSQDSSGINIYPTVEVIE